VAGTHVVADVSFLCRDIYNASTLFDHPYVYQVYHAPRSLPSVSSHVRFVLLWQIYTFVLGFVLVFRCNLAYQRFWEGRTCLELMSSKWSDAALQTVIFDNVANKSEVDRLAFRARMLSLFSLLHATALAKLPHRRKRR
jgi:hypothetical protein